MASSVVRPRPPNVDVADIDVGAACEQDVAAGAGGALRLDDHVAGPVGDVRQELEHAVAVARAGMIELQGSRSA